MTTSRNALRLATLLALLGADARARAGDAPPAGAPPPPGTCPLDEAFLPAADLGARAFRAARPEADGRGVIVAVLDTGVDPGHARLATTTTGERTLVDLLDATDDGFVELEPIPDVRDGAMHGPSGRRLDLGTHVRAGRGARLGRIDSRNVLPPSLVERTRSRRRERLDAANRRIRESSSPAPAPRASETPEQAAARRAAETEARAALPDDSPVFDLLVVETDAGPRAVIDTDADGDLAEERELGDFGATGDYAALGDDTELNVAVAVDADLRRARLLFDGGGHGTHVAGIVAGHDVAGGVLDGVAPGARILSIKVGNSRFGGATTNLSILRALEWAGRRGATVVNLSFGGSSFTGDAGTTDTRAADDAVERYGLLCCFSAGNDGPLLSTVGSPATARRVLSVGAYVSPGTMRASYGRLDDVPGERLFGFSSRGPLPGGDLGVSVLAPGAAWSGVPAWHLICGDNWNGTSMAAPEVAGAAALLVSAAKADGVPVTPLRLVRAITSSAREVPGLLRCEQGAGLVQVERAYEALRAGKGRAEPRRLEARVENETGAGGGIHVRPALGDAAIERDVRVRVDWPSDVSNAERSAYERRLVLASDAPFVTAPARLGLHAGGATFRVRVALSGLAPGVHEARVRATDPDRPEDGTVLDVPVTVVRPTPLDDAGRLQASATAAPGQRLSWFVVAPPGASALSVRLRNEGPEPELFTVAAGALDLWRRADERRVQRRATLGRGEDATLSVSVLPDAVVEVAVFSHWNANGPARLSIDARFEGPTSPQSEIRVEPGLDVALVRLDAALAPLSADVVAVIDRAVEHPDVTRVVEPDVSGGRVLDGEGLFVARQRFSVTVREGESTTVVPTGDAGLDEMREDARWRVLDAAGRVRKKAVVDGAFDLDGLPAGRFAVEYETPAWRRAGADAGTTGFELRRSIPVVTGSTHATADAAAEARDAASRVDWPRGALRSVAIRIPALAAGRTYRGHVDVRVDGQVRLSIPLLVERRVTAPGDAAGAEAALVAALVERARDACDDPDAAPDALRDAKAAADRARTLRPDDLGIEELAVRACAAAASDAAARRDALARADALVTRLDRTKAEDRPRLGRALLVRARLARLDGRPADADLSEARFLLPDDEVDVLRERAARGASTGGDAADGVRAARTLAERRPTSFGAASDLVRAELALGWEVAAAHDVRGLVERFPSRRAEIAALAAQVRERGGDPAPRSLEAITGGAP